MGRRGRVLHFAADWLPASEVFVYDLVRSLRHPPLVVAGNRLQNIERFPLRRVHSLAPLSRLRPAGVRGRVTEAVLGALVHRYGVGLVHVHHGYQVERVTSVVRRHRLPLVLSLHGHDVTGYLAHRPSAYKEASTLATAVVVPSRYLGNLAVAAGFDATSVRVLPSGVDTSFFTPSPLPTGPPTALFVGRFVEKKGLDVLARAWPLVRRRMPSAQLIVAGFGELEPLARAIEGDVHVELTPSRATVRRLMGRARVVVTPSHCARDDAVESLLMVNLEAQASGRPVVTTAHGGIPEFVQPDRTALVVPENDAAALAGALTSVLADDALAARLAQNGPAAVEWLSLDRVAARMDALYDEVWEMAS